MATNLTRFDFEVNEKEQLDVKIIMPRDERGVIHGVVLDKYGRAVEDAVVKLFEAVEKKGKDDCFDKDDRFDKCELKPITHAFTDKCGQFLFGPLCPHKKHTIKVWFNAVKCRCDVFHGRADYDCLKPCCDYKDHKDSKPYGYEEEKQRGIEIKTHLEAPKTESYDA